MLLADFTTKKLRCVNSIPADRSQSNFEIAYDRLVIAVGAEANTFNTPGVREHAQFLRQVSDARQIRRRVNDCA